jgi:hypothetical protein
MIYLLYGEFNLLFALYYVKKNGSALMMLIFLLFFKLLFIA